MSSAPQSPTSSRSQGHSAFFSSGRGGAGNIRSSSKSRGSDSQHANPGPDDYPAPRGRELPVKQNEKQRLFGSGRGGAGNIHAPSRGAAIETRNALREEAKYAQKSAKSGGQVSHGRGGAGNFSFFSPRSRSKTPKPIKISPELPADISTEVPVVDAANGSEETPSTERIAHGQEKHHSSGVSKITKLFRPRRKRRSKVKPRAPEESPEPGENYILRDVFETGPLKFL